VIIHENILDTPVFDPVEEQRKKNSMLLEMEFESPVKP
jgi:hypothetical protein